MHQQFNRANGRLLFLMAAALMLSGCAQTSVVDSWRTDQPVTNKPDKVAVIAVLPDALVRESVEGDVAAAARLAVAGRVRLLLSEKGRRIWGRFDPQTGDVEIVQEGGADPGGNAVDLIDEIAEKTLQLGGRALTLAPERMPTDTGIGAVLR